MTKITTYPVYSKIATAVPAEIQTRQPQTWRLSAHQITTYEALISNQYDVVINTAMTGDGKSLAAYMPALVNNWPLLTLYPTNELSRDQEMQMPSMQEHWQNKLRHIRVSARLLEQRIADGQARHKLGALDFLSTNYDLILTNPDIFHYMAQFFYTRGGDAPDKLFVRRIVDQFAQFAFDEFHIFSTPQIVSVVNAMLLIREVASGKKFLFLSATPDEQMLAYLDRAGFRVKEIRGEYSHSLITPNKLEWRPIIRGTDIYIEKGKVEEWVEAYLEDRLLPFFRQNHPAAKGAIIVNSVASAYRLHARLAPRFKAEGLSVILNTGLTSDNLKEASRNSNLLIGTSTVDVGVDFRINFLLFESQDAGTFLQRLGRLGRHDDDGQGHAFSQFEAHALVPNFVHERLFANGLTNDGEFTREELATAVRTAYPPPASFPAYAQKWGRIQAAHVFYSLHNPTVRDTYTQTRDNLKQHYWQTFHINIIQAVKDYKEWRTDYKQLLEEAQSFRGGSPLQCGIIDETETGAAQVKQYNLLTLIANARLEWLGKDEFTAVARRLTNDSVPFKTDDLLGWFRFFGFEQTYNPFTFSIYHPIDSWAADRLGQPCILSKIELDMGGAPWLSDLNRHMRQRKFVVTLCRAARDDLRYGFYLPPMFQIHLFRSPLDNSEGSIAFGRYALLLNVALEQRRFDCGGSSALFA
ncbi:MAG: type I-D CRISPR-associated helicase Cas3' [Anaerolineae bacterium]|nr:type I-D CRISPR-associated helicase Cas3' [Anaerolineae bacterium]